VPGATCRRSDNGESWRLLRALMCARIFCIVIRSSILYVNTDHRAPLSRSQSKTGLASIDVRSGSLEKATSAAAIALSVRRTGTYPSAEAAGSSNGLSDYAICSVGRTSNRHLQGRLAGDDELRPCGGQNRSFGGASIHLEFLPREARRSAANWTPNACVARATVCIISQSDFLAN
jgi:hypothetical protein